MKFLIAVLLAVFLYSVIGTSHKVDEIKKKAVVEIPERGWEILRYDGYQFGSWSHSGGKVWYYVKDKNHKNTYYKVYVTIWDGELQYYYDDPEKLNRINIDNP